MSKLTISAFVKTLMPVLNRENTQEEAFILLFDPVCDKLPDIDLSSKKISNVMNDKEDIHEAIRRTANDPGSTVKIRNNFRMKVVPILRDSLKDNLLYEYSQLIKNDNNIAPKKKEELLEIIEDEYDDDKLAELLTKLFLYVISIPFKKHDEFRQIHYISKAVNIHGNENILSVIKQQFGAFIDLDKGNAHKELIIGKLYKLTSKCSFESAIVRGVYMTNVEFEYADIKYKAATSCDNWLSQSNMDNILSAGTSTVTLIFDVLNKDNGTAHIYLIGELYK